MPILETLIGGGLFTLVGKVADKIWPDPVERAASLAAVMKAEQEGRLQEINAQLAAILEEARSPDPWTSRARPSFLYVMYVMILTALPFSVLWAFEPAIAERISTGMQKWLAAIPESLWALFGVGYLGYTGARSWDKAKGTAK